MRKDYRDFISHVLYDMNLRRIMMTDIYNTKYYLNTEYMNLFAKGNARLYFLHFPFALDSELEFYLYLDMLTYLPFEKLGYEYLNNKLVKENSSIIEFKFNKIMKILDEAKFDVDEKLKNNIKYFLNSYYNDIIEINIIGLSIILLRLFHRYVTIMNFNTFVGGSMGIHKKIDDILDKIVDEVNSKGLKEININNYLPEFDYNNKLNDDMIKYIELCLERAN